MILRTADRRITRVTRENLTNQNALIPLSKICENTYSGTAQILFLSINLRLDNSQALCSSLGLPQGTDTITILKAGWAEWGTDIPQKLMGSFGFAIHDLPSQTVHIFRDHMGISPVFYALSEKHLSVGATSRDVRSTLAAPAKPNKAMLSDFIAGRFTTTDETFFTGVRRLPPASHLAVTEISHNIRTYWDLRNTAITDPTDKTVDTFRRLFDEAVKSNDKPGHSALMLSGGLDSSAIAASLCSKPHREITLPCLSMTFSQTPNWKDETHLKAVVAHCGVIDHRKVKSDAFDPLDRADFWLSELDGPYFPYGHAVTCQILDICRERGLDIVLHGHGGDEIVSYGFGRLNELALQRKWWTLWRQTSGPAHLAGSSRMKLLLKYLSHYPLVRKILLRLYARVSPPLSGADEGAEAYVDAGLLDEVGHARYDVQIPGNSKFHNERMIQEDNLTNPSQPLSLEVIAISSAALGVQTRMPFYDKALVEYCLSLPSRWKLDKGLTRYILREAFRGDLPASVLRRKDKYDFTDTFKTGLLTRRQALLELTDPGQHAVGPYVNLQTLNRIRNTLIAENEDIDRFDFFFLWRVAILSKWLNIRDKKLSKPDFETGLGA